MTLILKLKVSNICRPWRNRFRRKQKALEVPTADRYSGAEARVPPNEPGPRLVRKEA